MTVQNFNQVVTIAGRAADAASRLPGGAPLNFLGGAIVFGDGNGAPVSPLETQVALVNPMASMPVSAVYADAIDPTIWWVDCTYGDYPGHVAPRGYTIREMGVKLPDGTLYSVGAYPDTDLPAPTSGAALSLQISIPFIETTAGANITIGVNENLYATMAWVDAQIGEVSGDLLALIAWRARAELMNEERIRFLDAHTFDLNQRLRAAGL